MRIDNLINSNKDFISFEELALIATLRPNDEIKRFIRFGINSDIDAGVVEDIWSPGGTRSYLSSAETMDIVSSSANDAPEGTGVGSVNIIGLDADYNEITENVELNGTTEVVSSNSYIEILRVSGADAGSGETNAGTITITSSSSSTLLAQIDAGDGITQMSHYTVPAGYTAYMIQEDRSIYKPDGTGTRQGRVDLLIKRGDTSPWIKTFSRGTASDVIIPDLKLPIILYEKNKIKYQAEVGQNTTAVSAGYGLILIKNEV